MAETPSRNIRVSDELWEAAKEQAWRERTTVAAAITAFLTEWTAPTPMSATPTVVDRPAVPGAGVLSAEPVIVPAEPRKCDHAPGARDKKNPSRCRCGVVNLPPPGKKA